MRGLCRRLAKVEKVLAGPAESPAPGVCIIQHRDGTCTCAGETYPDKDAAIAANPASVHLVIVSVDGRKAP